MSTGLTSFRDIMANRNVPSMKVIKKFGRNLALGTTNVPMTIGGIWRTPQVAAATALRVKAGNTNDTAAGSGAQSVTIEGLDETGAFVSETVATAGTSASAATTATYIRVYRIYVAASGTYATAAAGSSAANIVIENAAGTEDWATIDTTDYPRSQGEIGCYAVPLGKEAYIAHVSFTSAANKVVSLNMYQRQDILDAAAPYKANRQILAITSKNDDGYQPSSLYYGPFPALTDIMSMGHVDSGATIVSIGFTILEIDAL